MTTEKQATHTPGPWTLDAHNPRKIVSEEWTTTVASVSRRDDARLIAATPELLQALRAILGLSTYDESATEEAMAQIQVVCRDAIAKTKGAA